MKSDERHPPPAPPGDSESDAVLEQRRPEHRATAELECLPGRGRYHRANCSEAEARELLAIAKRPPPGMRIYKYGSRSVVGAFGLTSGLQVCLKYYFPNRFYKHVSYGFGGSRCRRSWLAALAFARAGIPTPAPLAVLEWKKFGGVWLDQAFLATRQAEGISLAEFARTHRADRDRLERIAGKLREYFSTMANHRIVHGDLKATNILVDETDRISFIDLDAFSLVTSSSRWKKLREKDARIFAENWKNDPNLADTFHAVFRRESAASSDRGSV